METKKPATLFINGKAFDCTIVESAPVKKVVNEEPIEPMTFSGNFSIRTEQYLGIKQLLTEMN